MEIDLILCTLDLSIIKVRKTKIQRLNFQNIKKLHLIWCDLEV